MKNMMKFWISGFIALTMQGQTSFAQSIDEDRMKRDIEIGETVLATVIKQQMNQQRTFFGIDIKGSYQPGYGVTFRLPGDHSMPFVISLDGNDFGGGPMIAPAKSYRYSITTNGSSEDDSRNENGAYILKEKPTKIETKEKSLLSADTIRSEYNDRVIQAAKDFILDYGDIVSQLAANEKLVVTNQGDRQQFFFNSAKRTRISVEGTKADITAFKQGKMSRDQAMKKLTVINTESVEAKEPDMEMLSSIFSRLYRHDLSKTYFTEGNVYYERLKDYGTIFYMQMVSSVASDLNLNKFQMPTLGLNNLDQETRDKKVAGLYPAFEKDMKENILEYGRTLKSLKDEEVLVFNVALTRCVGCGIPATLELTIKSAVLKEFGAGKIDKSAAMGKFTLKKGANQ